MDVQRTASNDLTGTACQNFSPDQQCIGLCLLFIIFYSIILHNRFTQNNTLNDFSFFNNSTQLKRNRNFFNLNKNKKTFKNICLYEKCSVYIKNKLKKRKNM